MKKLFKLLFSRLFFGGVFIVFQVAVLVLTLYYFQDIYAQVQTVFTVLSIIAVLYIVNQEGSSAFKIAWILPIVFLPLFGIPLYFLFGKKRVPERKRERISGMYLRYRPRCARCWAAARPTARRTGTRGFSRRISRTAPAPPPSRRRRRPTTPWATSSSPPCSRSSARRKSTSSWSTS